jgi:hypothetical protein
MWFEQLTGFKEESPENVRKNIVIDGTELISLANNKRYHFGKLEIATLADLRQNNHLLEGYNDAIEISEIVADAQILHCQPENANALFQVASQFNLLEMISPNIIPEQGIDRYENDHTQGPVCAIACGAGTLFRNYFAETNGQIGQTEHNQINCLDLIAKELDNERLDLWKMRNGYAMISERGLLTINKNIAQLSAHDREDLKGKLKTGIQWNTEVTLAATKQRVSQIFCSALPVAYCQTEPIYWESFARVILEALYESTLYAGMLNMIEHQSNIVYLTLVGGGAFGNEEYWIIESMQKAFKKFKNVPLDVRIVSYGKSNKNIQQLLNDL